MAWPTSNCLNENVIIFLILIIEFLIHTLLTEDVIPVRNIVKP